MFTICNLGENGNNKKEKKEIILFEHKNQTKRTKIVCQHQADFHFQSVLAMYKTQKMIFRSLY